MRVTVLALAILGSTSVLALDLPKEAMAPTSEACPGRPGFVRIPGTQSCTRLSGRVAAGAGIGSGTRALATPDVTGRIAVDNRTQTDFGEVRTYVRIGNGRR